MNAVQLPFRFDAQQIQQELQAIAKFFTPIISTRIKENDLLGMHLITPALEGKKDGNGFTYHPTTALIQSPYLQSVLNTFQCNKFVYRVHNLTAGGKIELHQDMGKGLSNKIVRIHIPATTNEEIYFYINEERISMQNGECWFTDVTRPHEVENRSNSDRLQLMIDCDLNDWWRKILTELGIQWEKTSEWENYKVEELLVIKQNFMDMKLGLDHPTMRSIELEIEGRSGKVL